MGIMEKLKSSKLAGWFRSILGQKSLPESSTKDVLEDVYIEPENEHNKFVQEMQDIANDMSRFSRDDAIAKILKDIGLKQEILYNKDAMKKVMELADEEINITENGEKRYISITNNNVEDVKSKLTRIVNNGRIEKCDEIKDEDFLDSKTIIIDVDEQGRTIIDKNSVHKENENKFVDLKLHSDKSEKDALEESGYKSEIIYDRTVIDSGVEIEKSHQFIRNAQSMETHEDKVVKVTRNDDLVTASVKVVDSLTAEERVEKNRWANIFQDGNPLVLTGTEEILTDISEIDKMPSTWCIGTLPDDLEQRQILIKNKQNSAKYNPDIKKLMEKRGLEFETKESEIIEDK